MTTVPDLAYTAARLTSVISVLLAVLSGLLMAYGIWTRNEAGLIDKSKDLLAIAKDARNVFLAFLVVLLLTVAPGVKLDEKPLVEALVDLTKTYCQGMLAVLVITFACSALGVFRGPLLASTKEHIGAMRLHSLVLAILGLLMTYALTLPS